MLLIASSANSLKLVGKHLREYFSVLTAENEEDAWDVMLEQREVVLLICELELMINQFGLLERIRSASDSWLAATPILLLVGESDTDDGRELAFQMGATDFINLPFASTELTARARLHANLYLQNSMESTEELQSVSAVNLLQQLSQRNFFNSRAQQELSFSQRHRSSISLCKIKLDKVKSIVSAFDKATAISVIKAVAGIIQKTLRREDGLCYLGNAEFYVLYSATNGIGAVAGTNRILKGVSKTRIKIAGKQVPVTVSASVFSCVATESTSLEVIYKHLDKSLTQARADGGNKVVAIRPADEEAAYSIDRALRLIESNSTDDLEAHAAELVLTALPLVEFANSVLGLELETTTRKLHEQLQDLVPKDLGQ